MPKPRVDIKRFLPKGPYVGVVRTPKETVAAKVTSAVHPGKTKDSARARAFFEKHGITNFKAKPMKPLSRKEEIELRKLLGKENDETVGFYRDNRNLFMAEEKRFKENKIKVTFRRLNRSGVPEETNYASIVFIEKEGRKWIKITTAGIDGKFRNNHRTFLSSPKPVFSGRGILSAFVDFVEKRGIEEITVTPGLHSEEAYKRAGFSYQGKGGPDTPIWRRKK